MDSAGRGADKDSRSDSVPVADVSGVMITNEQLRSKFNEFDIHRQGFISRRDLKNCYKAFDTFGLEESESSIDSVLSRCDSEQISCIEGNS